jgi:hypothetical protein
MDKQPKSRIRQRVIHPIYGTAVVLGYKEILGQVCCTCMFEDENIGRVTVLENKLMLYQLVEGEVEHEVEFIPADDETEVEFSPGFEQHERKQDFRQEGKKVCIPLKAV